MILLQTSEATANRLDGRSSRRHAMRGWLVGMVLAAWVHLGLPVQAQDADLEYKLKAAFLFNFINFVEWPTNKLANQQSTVLVGCLADDPAAPILARALEGKPGRPIKLVVFKEKEDPSECHLLFLSRARKALVEETLAKLQKAPVLTVSEIELFAQRGGMINFVRHERTFRFEINLDAADRAGLRISSKLASMATVIKTNAP